jgi:aminoglycoside phosphotransferase (APT) family kinase protein
MIERLQAAVTRHIGPPGTIHDLVRLSGGAVKATWRFDAESGEARLPCILQTTDATDEASGGLPRIGPAEDAALLHVLGEAGLATPRLLAQLVPADGLGEGYITQRVDGETLAPRILRDAAYGEARQKLAAQCGQFLAALHGLAPERMGFLKKSDAATQLGQYRRVVDGIGLQHPALEYAFAWVAKHLPPPGPARPVHGDFRLGNLIIGRDGLRCVLDWELACLGDPMQDLGWLCLKTWRFGGALPVAGCGKREDLFSAYEAAGGGIVDPQRVRFWEAFGGLKWAVMCLSMADGAQQDKQGGKLEPMAIGRRMEEPLWDFMALVTSASD